MKIILLLLLLLVSFGANAEFKYFITNNEDSELWVDYSSIRSNKNFIKVWTMMKYNKTTEYGINSDKTQQEFDCKNGLIRYIYWAFYSDREGSQLVRTSSINKEWEPIIPDSINYLLLQKVCGK